MDSLQVVFQDVPALKELVLTNAWLFWAAITFSACAVRVLPVDIATMAAQIRTSGKGLQ